MGAQKAARSMLGVDSKAIDFLPVFYSRILNYSWEMVGKQGPNTLIFGLVDGKPEEKFGCVWTNETNNLTGIYLEGGNAADKDKLAKLARAMEVLPPSAFNDPAALKRYVLA